MIASARLQMEPDGTVRIMHNATDLGQGVYSTLSLIAAKTLDLPQSRIRVDAPDTSTGVPFPGTSSQRTTVQMGNAVVDGCQKLREQLVDLAVETHGGEHSAWRFSQGELWREGKEYPLRDILKETSAALLSVLGEDTEKPVDAAFGAFDFWSPGGAATEVEVDMETGEFRVLSCALSTDAGKVIHYSSARAQLEGGAVMGFGLALGEELVYDEGQTMNADPFQYKLPQMHEIPERFSSVMLESGSGPGPFGSKGISQVSIPCIAPAIANAIADATGVSITSMPITAEKILHALGKL